MTQELVEGRSCGDCTVCCTVLKVDEPDFQKQAGETCAHCAMGQGCTIYETRYAVCRVWFCGYRTLDWIEPDMRPDQAGVIVFRGKGAVPEQFDEALSLNFLVMSQSALRAPSVIAAMCQAIAAGRATKLVVPGPPGGMPYVYLVNDIVEGVWSDKWPRLLERELKKIYLGFRFMGETGVSAS